VPPLTGALTALDEQIEAARAQGQMVRTAIETRDPVRLQSASEAIEQRLGEARAILAEGNARATTTQAALIDISRALTFWSTVSTAAISALLAILAAGQISLERR